MAEINLLLLVVVLFATSIVFLLWSIFARMENKDSELALNRYRNLYDERCEEVKFLKGRRETNTKMIDELREKIKKRDEHIGRCNELVAITGKENIELTEEAVQLTSKLADRDETIDRLQCRIKDNDLAFRCHLDWHCGATEQYNKTYTKLRNQLGLMFRLYETMDKTLDFEIPRLYEQPEMNKEQPMQKWSERITKWASDRNLIEGSSPDLQMAKLYEEVEELSYAIDSADTNEIIDAIGDIQVVLGVMCAQLGLDIDECREAAWNEIKDRTGKMIDGVFVKDA